METTASNQDIEDAQKENHFNLVSGSATLNIIVVWSLLGGIGSLLYYLKLLPLESILAIGSILILLYTPFGLWELSQVLCKRSLAANNRDSKIFIMSIQTTTRDSEPVGPRVNSTWSSLSERERKQFE